MIKVGDCREYNDERRMVSLKWLLHKKLGAPCGTPSNDMFLILQLQFVSALNELAHSPDCAYVQIVVENHNIGILASKQ